MKLTKGGVCYNLNITPFTFTTNDELYTFYFSSENHLNKFIERRKENQEIINYSLSKRFGFKIKCKIIGDIFTYSSIETRGFLIKKVITVIPNDYKLKAHKEEIFYTNKKDLEMEFEEIL